MNKPLALLSFLIFALLMLAACAPSPDPEVLPLVDAPEGTRTRPAPTKKPPTKTPVPSATQTPPPTFTKTPVPTPTSSTAPTKTPIPAATPTPGVTPTGPAGVCPEHENEWHAPADEPCQRHHHGVNPRDYCAVFNYPGFDCDAYLNQYGELRQVWETSTSEEWNGYVWLYEHIEDCEQYAPASDPGMWDEWDCPTDLLIRVHDTGTADHFIKRFHSETFIIKGCEKLPSGLPDFSKCGVIATGDHHDYGEMHTPYKKVHCPVYDVDPPGFFELDQPPYRAHTTLDPLKPPTNLVVQFWSGQAPNPINNPNGLYYPHGPNALVGFGWSSSDAWQIWDPAICGRNYLEMAALAMNLPVVEGNEHKTFQIFNLNIQAHPPGPFVGWTDQNGHVWAEGVCSEASPTCIPLIITAGFPDSRLIIQRRVDQGNCDFAPCLVIDDQGVVLVFPAWDVP